MNEYGDGPNSPLRDRLDIHVYRSVLEGNSPVWIQTHAKEKLPTFCIAATGAPLMVIFVNGVFVRVWAPDQSIAKTEAWPPNQLQLKCQKP